MKKLLISLICVTILAITVVSVYAFIDINQILIIGTKEVKFDNPIYVIDDKTYVPIRELCDKLGIPISWDSEKRQVKVDINNKEIPHNNTVANAVLENGVIPNEETAKTIAKSILESCIGKPVEYKVDGYEFYLTVDFSEEQNSWVVTQYAKYNGNSFGGGNVSPVIRLNKSTGEVVGINLESSWDRIIEAHKKQLGNKIQ